MIKIKYPRSNTKSKEYEVDFHTFSAGEVHTNIIFDGIARMFPVVITARINSSDELMKLLILTDAVRRQCKNDIELVMPYIPYSRQDRACVDGDAFSLKVFCDIINSQKYSKVTVVDSHSIVATALLDNVFEIPQDAMAWITRIKIESFCGASVVDYVISPDAGAAKKSQNWVDKMESPSTSVIQCLKTRSKEGSITDSRILQDDFAHKNCLIVDDICDGGGSFIPLVKNLKIMGASKVFLYVTHGIFSRGLDCLFDARIDGIFTTDSFEQKDPRVVVVKEFFGEN